jgi:hypothetical protein
MDSTQNYNSRDHASVMLVTTLHDEFDRFVFIMAEARVCSWFQTVQVEYTLKTTAFGKAFSGHPLMFSFISRSQHILRCKNRL